MVQTVLSSNCQPRDSPFMRILLVEDDELLALGIQRALVREGFHVDWLDNGQHAYDALTTETFDIVILDLSLPGKDGLDVLAHARKHNNTSPVLILTARDTVNDRVQGLDSGADDYLVKPFELIELKARVRALTRRAHGHAAPLIEVAGIVLDPASHAVTFKGQVVNVSRREYSLLLELLSSPGQVFSREQLEEKLYGWNEGVSSNSVEVHISNLRKKFHSDLIKTVRGIGYQLNTDL